MSKNKRKGGAANSFHIVYLRENMVGQNFRGSKVVEVTNKYINTEDGSFSKKGLNVDFEEVNPNAGGFVNNRRD
jgi:hypothetical protein